METQIAKYVSIALVLLGFLVAIWLSKSNTQDQTRPLAYTKGVYGGATDKALDETTVDALRRRTSHYRSSGI